MQLDSNNFFVINFQNKNRVFMKNYILSLVFFLALNIKAFCLTEEASSKIFLVFGGKTGWIGQKMVKLLEAGNHMVVTADSRLECRESIKQELLKVNPDFIINCAGVTGTPNVDWCETHKTETIRTNIIGILNLIDVAYEYAIPVTNFSTGCIYTYDDEHSLGSHKGFTENDEPNFEGSFYAKTKVFSEKMMLYYPNLLNLRIKMPISSDLHPKSFLTKIIHHKKVIDIPNSISILDDLLPEAIYMTLKGVKGCFNFVNPGVLSHNEVLELYIKYVDPMFHYENFTEEEMNQMLKSRRANAELDTSKLLQICPHIPNVKDSIHKVFNIIKKQAV